MTDLGYWTREADQQAESRYGLELYSYASKKPTPMETILTTQRSGLVLQLGARSFLVDGNLFVKRLLDAKEAKRLLFRQTLLAKIWQSRVEFGAPIHLPWMLQERDKTKRQFYEARLFFSSSALPVAEWVCCAEPTSNKKILQQICMHLCERFVMGASVDKSDLLVAKQDEQQAPLVVGVGLTSKNDCVKQVEEEYKSDKHTVVDLLALDSWPAESKAIVCQFLSEQWLELSLEMEQKMATKEVWQQVYAWREQCSAGESVLAMQKRFFALHAALLCRRIQ